jgi:hypothetical protein
MKKTFLFAVVTMLSLFASDARAADAAFDSFWTKFKAALQKNDKEAIATMTKLPYQGGDKPMDRKAFIANSEKIFPKKTRNCLVKEKPVLDKTSYFVFCGEEIFIFEKVNGKYLFTEIGVND